MKNPELNKAIQEIIGSHDEESALFAVGSLLRSMGDMCNSFEEGGKLFDLARKIEEVDALNEWEEDRTSN